MAATLQSLFPFTTNKGKDFNVYPVYTKFSAPIINGKYVFSEATTPAQVFGKLLQGQFGVIAGVMISANCSADDFTANVNDALTLQIVHAGNNTPINMSAYPFSSFAHGDNYQAQWEITSATTQQEEDFKLSVSGEVDQIAGMLSNELELRIAFNFIRTSKEKLDGRDLIQVVKNG